VTYCAILFPQDSEMKGPAFSGGNKMKTQITSCRLLTSTFAVLGVSASFFFFGTPAVEAHRHQEGGHAAHLWTEDRAAYEHYDPAPVTGFHSKKNLSFLSDSDLFFLKDEYLVDTLAILSGEKDPVLANRGRKEGRAAAREFMRQEFESFGYKVSEHTYRSGTNLIAEKAGPSGKFLIVSAHYDSVNNAGADDDASGVVAMLATARLLRDKDLKHGVRFVAFDEEELGLVGSRAYVKELVARGEAGQILGDLQMEMMGYNAKKDGRFHVISCDRPDSRFLVDAFVETVRNLPSGLKITETCTDRSDHASFWDHDIPAIVISENFFGGDSNPCYHRACDRMEGMHLDYFVNVAEAAANTALLIVTK
jgi:hypothetical protein